MTRVVFVTQHVDPEHPVLAATVPMIRALAERADELVVLALGARPVELPANTSVRLFGGPLKPLRGVRFVRALAGVLRRDAVVVAHMCPIYAVLAAPLARPLGVPVVLWYTHWRATPTLRLAERAATAITSVDRRSFPLESRKVVGIGHGIELAEFPCRPAPPAREGLRLLALGRTSPAKGLPAIAEAVELARGRGTEVTLEVRGPSLTAEERAHREQLARLGVDVLAPVPRSEIPRLLGEADALVNNMRAGAPDKVVFEAAASCVPVFASNPVFDSLLPDSLRFARDRPDELAERLAAFAELSQEERAELGRSLRERVAEGHSVGTWAERLLAAAGQ